MMRTNTFADTRKKAFNLSGKHFHIILILFVLSGAIMVGHGLRMMYQGLFQPQSYYPAPTPHTIDFYFDWFTLAVLGFFILGFAFYNWYKHYKKIQKQQRILTKLSDETRYHQPT